MFHKTHATMEAITSVKVVPPVIKSLDQIPEAFNYVIGELVSLRQALAEKGSSTPEPDQWFNLEEFCQYHPSKPAATTVYGWVSRRAVPHKRDGKHLLFLKSEIDGWLKAKSRKTSDELAQAAEMHLTSMQRKGGRRSA